MKVELLAPAGSYESMVAAYRAGADAVYIGGTKFGARAFADNLDTERMKEAIDYAHLRGRKLYLTVNTLVKEKEIEDVYEYLLPFYREGLDAVIVQDFGVFQLVREAFPNMDLHASTQMTVTGVRGAAWLKERGAARVVTARELSMDEIRQIHDHVPVEIESFVHGALCFCYSGQCLLSSMIGGRSGNRGRCAQPCRLPYQLYEEGRQISRDGQPYLMSPKDMCTLDLIPDLIENGVYSFKMEGRMKKPEYTAGITAVYRKYIDRYLQNGKKGYQVSAEDRGILMDLYNRGGFSNGYYRQHNGRDMMSMERPNHWGTEAAKPVFSEKGIRWKALEELHPQDVLELRAKREKDVKTELTLTAKVQKGAVFSIKMGKNRPDKSALLYRTRNEQLLQLLKKEYLDTPYKVEADGVLLLKKGQQAQLQISCQGQTVTVSGSEVQGAQKRPVTEEEVRRQISKLGQTDFQWKRLEILMDEEVFVPMQELNELRRSAIEEMRQQVLKTYLRLEQADGGLDEDTEYSERENLSGSNSNTVAAAQTMENGTAELKESGTRPALTAEIQTEEQLREVLRCDAVSRSYISSMRYDSGRDFLEQAPADIARCHEQNKECWYVMPWIFREENRNYFRGEKETGAVLQQFDGLLIKNLEEMEYLQDLGYHGKIALDANLYIWNTRALRFWEGEDIAWITLPVELTDQELRQVPGAFPREMIVYGYTPLMVTAQCFQKNTTGCKKIRKVLQLKDRKNKYFPVKNDCSFCYNILYNSAVTELSDQSRTVKTIHPDSLRMSFTVESAVQVREVLQRYQAAFTEQQEVKAPEGAFTRGHLKRGVE